MVEGHKIKKRMDLNTFLELIKDYNKENIETSKHTFFRFSEEQRKIFNESFIKEFIINETPFLIGIQNNGLFALFYIHNKEIFRMIVDMQTNKIYIVTFYKIDKEQVPKI